MGQCVFCEDKTSTFCDDCGKGICKDHVAGRKGGGESDESLSEYCPNCAKNL